MECERFKHLLKLWYTQVQEETLAPARMVDLMENHISECSICRMDPNSKKNIEKIITLVLPKDKLSPPSRSNRTVKPTIDGSGPGPGGMVGKAASQAGDISRHGVTDGNDAANEK